MSVGHAPVRGVPPVRGKEVSRVDVLEHVSPHAIHLNGLKPGPWRDARAASGFCSYGCQLAGTCSRETRRTRTEYPLASAPGSSRPSVAGSGWRHQITPERDGCRHPLTCTS